MVSFCDVILKCDVISKKCGGIVLMENDCKMTVEFDRHFMLTVVMAKTFQNDFVTTNRKCHHKFEIGLTSPLKDIPQREGAPRVRGIKK